MIGKAKKVFSQYRAEIAYLIVGGLTTLVNFIAYFMAREAFHLHYIEANVLAWLVAVLFAYASNRSWVFQSKNKNIILEILLFVLSRVFSLLLETVMLFIAVDILHISDLAAKMVIAILVVVCNYVTGKWVVFNRRK